MSILLPPDHALPRYQRRHRKYDRFLPHLVRYLQAPGTVIDVGANVGDTLAAMAAENGALDYVCIEADADFHALLETNAGRVRAARPGICIDLHRALVGARAKTATLEGAKGTRTAVETEGAGLASQRLDALLGAGLPSPLRLLKSDVDGHDHDVIASAEALIEAHRPLIFFECQYDDAGQKAAYLEMLRDLEGRGYRDWAVFDNFGELALRAGEVAPIEQLVEYVWRQTLGRSTRTVHYWDILAIGGEAESRLMDQVLADYDEF
jgi:FkbM family methyltransferase